MSDFQDGHLVTADHLSFRYSTVRKSAAWTLEDVNVSLSQSEALGIVGESGSGKSTLLRILSGLLAPTRGVVMFEGRSVSDWLSTAGTEFRQQIQIIFQNPRRSMDPRMRIGRSVSEAVRALERRSPAGEEVSTWLDQVGLGKEVLDRFPHQLSGGQLQRIAIARAISVNPRVLFADEPTSALDVSVQAQILNLLMELRERLGLGIVMVSHDLAVVSRLCERVLVLNEGRVVESGSTHEVLGEPKESYTQELVRAAKAVTLTA